MFRRIKQWYVDNYVKWYVVKYDFTWYHVKLIGACVNGRRFRLREATCLANDMNKLYAENTEAIPTKGDGVFYWVEEAK